MIYRHLGQFDFVYGVPVYIRYLYNKIQELAAVENKDKGELEKINSTLRKVSVFISGGDKIIEDELIWNSIILCNLDSNDYTLTDKRKTLNVIFTVIRRYFITQLINN